MQCFRITAGTGVLCALIASCSREMLPLRPPYCATERDEHIPRTNTLSARHATPVPSPVGNNVALSLSLSLLYANLNGNRNLIIVQINAK